MPSITDSIGRVLGDRYRLVTALGTGASAHVYLADDVSLHRRVAIKVLHPALAGDADFLRRFRAEARAVAALNHPNILQVYDWGEEHDEPYLVLEYLAGGSLRQVFDTGALLSPEQAVRIGLQAAAGLDYAHRRGLIHRDIKPANLLFDAEARLRIADFGLARALAEASWTEPDGACSERPATRRPSRWRDGCSTARPMSTPWPWCSTRGSPGRRPSSGTPPSPPSWPGWVPSSPSTTPSARSTTCWSGRPPPSRPSASTPPSSRSGWRSSPPPFPSPGPCLSSTPSPSRRPTTSTGS